MKSQTVDSSTDILRRSENAEVIGIDEAQFFDDKLIDVCIELARLKKRVIVAGLDKDYLADPFGPIPALLAEAEYITKTLAICVICGNPANYTQRLSEESERIIIGEKELYEARCRNCYESPD